MFVFVIDGYEEENKEREDANGNGGRQSFGPQHVVEGYLLRTGVVVMVVVFVVAVSQTHFRQSQEHEDEQKRQANVFDTFLGRRHGSVGRFILPRRIDPLYSTATQ